MCDRIQNKHLAEMLERHNYSSEIRQIIEQENLLPCGVLNRLQALYPNYSSLLDTSPHFFAEKNQYAGIAGFREVVDILSRNGIDIGHIREREFFIEVYRFLITKHTLNSIDWRNFSNDSIFQLVFPQPGMIEKEAVDAYLNADSEEARARIVDEYSLKTNPHDGKQQFNTPWFTNDDGALEFLKGSQHKYPQIQLIFDSTTQHCFSYCTYCFRHAQVRGDEDMFLQQDIAQVHAYLKQHKEINDLLITGGDAGYIPIDRLEQYVRPIIEDPDLVHIKCIRLGSRALTYQPEMILKPAYDGMLKLFDYIRDNGVQVAWMAHFSTPRELLNPSTIAAIRRLRLHGVIVRSQSPMMKQISLFTKPDGSVDVGRSAQNWIDLANMLGMLGIGFHSMYCARPTGEHRYFTAPLADVLKVYNKIYRSLPSINRPTRHISMTISAGKISIMGTTEINGQTAFALKFSEARNMKWLDHVFLAKYDEQTNNVALLTPFEGDEFFFARELEEIENEISSVLAKQK